MKPLLLTPLGRTVSAAPLGRRGDDVEVRRIPALPTARALDPDRPTVIMLKPTFLFVLVVNSVRSLQVFTEVFVMTGGGPLHSTLTGVFYLYENAFYRFRLGYASAIAYLLFVLTLGLAFVQVRWLKLESPRS